MKKRKIIGGVLAVLMLCGILVGCSANSAQTAPYEKGTITETEFTSKWMGLKYTLQDDMYMIPEEYLIPFNDMAQVEMQVLMNDTSGDNIIVVTEDLSSLSFVDEKTYLEIAKPQVESLADEVTYDEVGQRTIAGETFFELPYHISTEVDGTSVTTNQTFLCKKLGDRMICMMLTHSGEDSVNYLLSGFSKI